MGQGWTGGQYSLYRVFFGTYLFCRFMNLFWGEVSRGFFDQPTKEGALFLAGGVCALFFCAGKWDKLAAWVMFLLLPWHRENLPVFGTFAVPNIYLIFHMLVPNAPYGSVQAMGRHDPSGGWNLPKEISHVAWLYLYTTYLYNGLFIGYEWLEGTLNSEWLPLWFGVTSLEVSPLAIRVLSGLIAIFYLGFCFGAAIPRFRFYAWTALFLVQLLILVTGMPLGGGWSLVLLHVLTFTPNWLPPRERTEKAYVFYDGQCGLCHRAMRFLLAEDPDGRLFRLAPLGGEAFLMHTEPSVREGLPDSIVLLTETGEIKTKSSAALEIMDRLGGYWRILAHPLRWVPRPIRDLFYDFIARIRYRLFKKPDDVCPVLPKHLRDRFEL